MANRLYQGVIHQMKDAINRTVGIIDESGVIVACSDPRLVGESRQGVREELSFSSNFHTSPSGPLPKEGGSIITAS